jgi:hypothetical protein
MIVAAAGFIATATAWAQPGFFYQFEQAGTGEKVCQPFAPDSSWIQVAGPFEDSNCEVQVEE